MALLLLYGNTHTGMRRQENEDAFIAQQLWLPHLHLLAAIDGVGGYAGGAFAARLAKDAIAQYMKEPKGDILTMLKEAVVFANNNIAAERGRQPGFSDMCCVLTAAVADTRSQSLSYVHVGDSRLYRFSADKLQKITKDHSLVGMQEDAGEISEQEAMQHPQRNMILREIGSSLHRVDDPGFLDAGVIPFLPGDQVLLCSDGLTDMLGAYQLQAV
ncbi:MAG: protein phosphatase 2C domain-containing protein, partial [Flavihumibacter sp.]